MNKYLLGVTIFLLSQNSTIFSQASSCKGIPNFLTSIGFEKSKSYLSTSEKNIVGIQAILSSDPGKETAKIIRTYQHDTWKSAGYLGALIVDKHGDTYVIPTPKITDNLNPLRLQNTIYKIDSNTGILEPYVSLPIEVNTNHKNPFGLIGMTYDCYTEQLIVSTILGSDEKKEVGQIYKISLKDKSWSLLIDNIDVYGISLFQDKNKKFLYLGKAKSQDLVMVELDNLCNVISPIINVLNIAAIGPRGDDKIKKIRFYDAKTMVLNATPFYYNLGAPSEVNQVEIRLKYFANKWNIVKII